MNVSLTPQLNKIVEQKVKTGRYTSASEVIRAGLRLLIEVDDQKKMEEEYTRQQILLGIKDLKEGKYRTYGTAAELMDDMRIELSTKKLKEK